MILALTLTDCLLILALTLLIAARLKNRSSTPPSPTPSTTPTNLSDEVVLKLMTVQNETWKAQMEQTRQMVADLTLGRESQSPTGETETWPMPSERLSDFDYDSIPLSPGIDAVLEREERETEQARILREREELQERLIEKQAELDHFNLEQSSEAGPWTNGDNPRHARSD